MAHQYGISSGQTGGIIQTDSRRAQTFAHFLKLLQARGGLGLALAERAAVSVMCVLEQRLYSGGVEDLESHLPFRLRELLQRCPSHLGMPPSRFGRDEFLQMVADDVGVEFDDAEHLTRAVFETVRDWLSDGEIDEVAHQLPPDLRALWVPEA